ncbi:hypothetical protein [Acidicapsa acidisoli]|uniref:hypothetical protein n=1 Tax=Acidicapsa acidisoli TaxID=1615681 RepID=UPI0021DFBAD6|nr:hypothetical protein [Acidicapsa acidisoli]
MDENLPHSLRRHIPNSVTAAYAGFAGLQNGKLLEAAEIAGFEVLVTGDKTLHHEQNLTGRKIALVSLSAVNWPLIEPHVAEIATSVDCAVPGSFTRID